MFPPASPHKQGEADTQAKNEVHMLDWPTLDTIRQAAQRIKPYVHCTPVLRSKTFDHWLNGEIHFKCENFQKAGAFKARGACNAVFSLDPEQARYGVITHSSGNHAAALSLAAKWRGIAAYIVMPENAPKVKQAAVAGYGGQVTLCAPNLAAREAAAEKTKARTGASLVHPYNDLRVIAGQATAALELLEQAPGLDLVLAPVGGGGLISGTALAVSFLSPQTQVIAAEPVGADDACRSRRAGRIIPMLEPKTVADGLRTSLGDITFAIMQKYLHDIVTVSEEAIIFAMRQAWERMKIVIEPSAAVPLAALLEKKLSVSGRRVGVILSGGNADLNNLPWLAR
jgi:threonine dehydratase